MERSTWRGRIGHTVQQLQISGRTWSVFRWTVLSLVSFPGETKLTALGRRLKKPEMKDWEKWQWFRGKQIWKNVSFNQHVSTSAFKNIKKRFTINQKALKCVFTCKPPADHWLLGVFERHWFTVCSFHSVAARYFKWDDSNTYFQVNWNKWNVQNHSCSTTFDQLKQVFLHLVEQEEVER